MRKLHFISLIFFFSIQPYAHSQTACSGKESIRQFAKDLQDKCSSGFQEVLSQEIGPRNKLGTNNHNKFDFSLVTAEAKVHSNCDLESFKKLKGQGPCPQDMQWVCSKHFKISVCVDRDLVTDGQGKPRGYMNRAQCEKACADQGKRMLSNNEWLVACTGTPHDSCLTYQGGWPPGHFAKVAGHPCQKGTTEGACMSSKDLISLMPELPSTCVSEAGVRGCVGTLGQWVSGNVRGSNGRFNGGLFPQQASSVVYSTVAHGPSYSDYSIGCRCGKSID